MRTVATQIGRLPNDISGGVTSNRPCNASVGLFSRPEVPPVVSTREDGGAAGGAGFTLVTGLNCAATRHMQHTETPIRHMHMKNNSEKTGRDR